MIELINVNQTYNPNTVIEVKALKNINLTINNGEFIGLIGHTGSGKSTLIQHLNGLIKPSSGEIKYDGIDIHSKEFEKNTLCNKVGVVFQYPEYQLFEETVYKDVAFGPKNMKLDENEIEKRVVEALSIVGIDKKFYEVSPFYLSGGQKRRVAIAGILAMKPEILVLDEPSAGLDPIGRKFILDGIKKLNKSYGIGIVMVSHSMEDIARYADRIVVMNKGEIVYDDTPEEIFSNYNALRDINLDIPIIVKLMNRLKNEGFKVDNKIFTIEAAKEEITKALNYD